MEVFLHTPICLSNMHKNKFTFLRIVFPSVSEPHFHVQNYRSFVLLQLTVLFQQAFYCSGIFHFHVTFLFTGSGHAFAFPSTFTGLLCDSRIISFWSILCYK